MPSLVEIGLVVLEKIILNFDNIFLVWFKEHSPSLEKMAPFYTRMLCAKSY